MPEVAKRWNVAAAWAFLLALAALSVNFIFFVNPPLQAALPWIGAVLAAAALVALAIALWRAIVHSHIYGGKALSIVLAVLTVAVSSANVFIFFHARALPNATGAPQVGQRLPDFTLTDTLGQSVSLDSLFEPQPGDPSPSAPKAVLLIFYRGYW
jgi:hypothetical protein